MSHILNFEDFLNEGGNEVTFSVDDDKLVQLTENFKVRFIGHERTTRSFSRD